MLTSTPLHDHCVSRSFTFNEEYTRHDGSLRPPFIPRCPRLRPSPSPVAGRRGDEASSRAPPPRWLPSSTCRRSSLAQRAIRPPRDGALAGRGGLRHEAHGFVPPELSKRREGGKTCVCVGLPAPWGLLA